MLIAQAVLNVHDAAVTDFSRRLRELFEARGWDVMELVRKTGLSRGAVSRHLNGRADPHYPIKVVYAQALGVPVEELAGRVQKRLVLSEGLSTKIRDYAKGNGHDDPIVWLTEVVEFHAPLGAAETASPHPHSGAEGKQPAAH